MTIIAVEDRAVFTHELQDRRRRGRPRVTEPMVSMTVRLPAATFDATCRLARSIGVSAPAVVREALTDFTSQSNRGSRERC